MNKLYFGDNLEVLRDHVASDSVDLVYLDPPFNSNANYNVLFGAQGHASEAQVEAFKDTWSWEDSARDAYQDLIERGDRVSLLVKGLRPLLGESTLMAYLVMMAVRLLELERVLKRTGSLYLHCDPTASHYLKILLDVVFDKGSFRNEVIWDYSFRLMDLPRFFNRKHDVILFYACSNDSYFKMPKSEWTREALIASRKQQIQTDENGIEWIWMPGGKGNSKSRLARVDEIIAGGKAMSDVWQMPIISSSSKERLGYPTQKPVALLERIIGASSKAGDVVLDPFCGCGTTIEAAKNLGRQWIGVDVTHYAITLIEKRLAKTGIIPSDYEVSGRPVDLAGARDLAARDKHQFQWWASWRLGAQTYREEKKGADRGVDGNIFYANGPYGTGRIIISVKGGENIGVAMVRDLRGVIEREDAEMGVLITLAEPTSPMVTEAAAAGVVRKSAHGRLPRLQIVTIEDILDGRMPQMPPLPVLPRQAATSRRKKSSDQIEMLLPLEGFNIKPTKGEFIDPRFMRMG